MIGAPFVIFRDFKLQCLKMGKVVSDCANPLRRAQVRRISWVRGVVGRLLD